MPTMHMVHLLQLKKARFEEKEKKKKEITTFNVAKDHVHGSYNFDVRSALAGRAQ